MWWKQGTLLNKSEKNFPDKGPGYSIKLLLTTINECIICHKLYGKMAYLKTIELLQERCTEKLVWICSKKEDQNLRFCDIPFPCFSNHVLHIEVDISLDVHSLLLATNRFMAKKGAVHLLWLDNGANFVGAKINCSKNSRKYSWIK